MVVMVLSGCSTNYVVLIKIFTVVVVLSKCKINAPEVPQKSLKLHLMLVCDYRPMVQWGSGPLMQDSYVENQSTQHSALWYGTRLQG